MSRYMVKTTGQSGRDDTGDDVVARRSAPLVLARRLRLSDQLYGQILEQIVSGRLSEGARLPSETEICKSFGVSRPVVRQALQRLRADGLVQARQGSGTYVQARPAERLADFVDPGAVSALLRCLEVRVGLEGAAARFAAERRGTRELDRIVAAHEALRVQADAGAMTAEVDFAFHVAIAEASGNGFFPRLLAELQAELRGFMALSLNLTRTGPSLRAAHVLHEHRLILDAIRGQEAEAAEIAMRFHIVQARRRMVDRNREG